MSELLREIEEDIRRERFEKFWRSFGSVMVVVCVGVVLAAAAWVFWRDHKLEDANKSTAQILKGIDRLNLEDYKGAVPIFSALTDDEKSPYWGVAMLRKAQAQELAGDKDGAAKTYGMIAQKDSEFSELAKIKTASSEQAEVGATSPFYYTLNEQNAWNLLAKGKKAEAADIFLALAQDKQSPATLANRAQLVVQHIAPEKLKFNAEAKN